MNKLISPKITALTFGVLIVSFLAVFYVFAWQEPTEVPPEGNVPTPLNVGNTGQSKEGGLILNTGGAEIGLVIDKGQVCIGADCRTGWPTGDVVVADGPSCPADYSPILFHYLSRTCTGRWCAESSYWYGCRRYAESSCTTPSGWDSGKGRTVLYTDCITYVCRQEFANFTEAPSCLYKVNETRMGLCYSNSFDRVVCVPD